MSSLREFISKHGGIVSVSQLASHLDVDPQVVRRWARDHDAPRVGSTFVFTPQQAAAAATDIEEDLEAEDDEDLDDEDEDDNLDDETEDDDDDD